MKKSLTMTALYPFTTAFQGFTYIDANIHTPIKALSIVDTQVSHFLVPQSLQLGPDTVYSIKTSTAALLKVKNTCFDMFESNLTWLCSLIPILCAIEVG